MKPDNIEDMIAGYLGLTGVIAALLVSDEGLAIDSVQSGDVDTETFSALVVDVVTAAQRFGREVDAGRLDMLTMEYGWLSVLSAPVNSRCHAGLDCSPRNVSGDQASRVAADAAPADPIWGTGRVHGDGQSAGFPAVNMPLLWN